VDVVANGSDSSVAVAESMAARACWMASSSTPVRIPASMSLRMERVSGS
jgi:hypothetical protein